MSCFTSSREHAGTGAQKQRMATGDDGQTSVTLVPQAPDRFPAPTSKGCRGGQLVLAIGPFRDWLHDHMLAHELTAMDVARRIGRDEAIVRGWFGIRSRDWRTQSPNHFVVHVISELVIEHVGIALTGNPRLVPELYAHMAEAVCQHCGATTNCHHLRRDPKPTNSPPSTSGPGLVAHHPAPTRLRARRRSDRLRPMSRLAPRTR
jgi:hypothetical protein